MAKEQVKPRKAQAKRQQISFDVPDPMRRHPHAMYLGILALLLVIFFNEAIFSGKVFNVPDNLSSLSLEQGYLEKAKADGINAFWNPYVFSGMPTWGSSTPGHGMYITTFLDPLPPTLLMKIYSGVQGVVNVLGVSPIFWDIVNFFLLGMFTYFFGIRRRFDPFVAFIIAVSVVFTLYSLNWIMAGHNTKITVFAWLPACLYLIDLLFEKKSPLYVAFLIGALHFSFNSGHVQMLFYALLTMGLYTLYKWYEGAKVKDVAIVGVILLFSAAFAFLMLSGPYFATWEYKDFSIRGAGSGGSGHGPASGGTDYQYATNWSFSPVEILTFFIPSFVGWGTPTYWGTMPFTESPIYLGIVISFLALLGILLRPKDKFVHFWMVLGLFAVLVSLGRNFGLVYDLMFNHVPFFNNFRIPSMILFLMGLCMSMLAGVGLSDIFRRLKTSGSDSGAPELRSLNKAVWVPVGVAAALFLVLLMSKGMMEETIASNMETNQPRMWQLIQQVEQAVAAGQGPQVFAQYPEYRHATREGIYSMALGDAGFAVVAMALVALVLLGFQRRTLNFTVFQFLLLALLIVDWWRVDFRPMKMEPGHTQEQRLTKNDVVDYLHKDTDIYRILPATEHAGDNWYAAFNIQSVAGYHPAKMRYYDDIRNTIFHEFQFPSVEYLDGANWPLLNMLNTRYVVVPKEFKPRAPWLEPAYSGVTQDVYRNRAVLPRAFFVTRSEVIEVDSLMFSRINDTSYRPERIAYLSRPLTAQITPSDADSAGFIGSAKLVSFGINSFEYDLETPQDAILKLSEIYYPSGWTATLDGEPVDILRSDYALRAVVVPKGSHRLVMSFEPKSYKAGLMITVVTNYLLVGVLVFYLIVWLLRRKPWQRGAKEAKA